MQDMLLDFIAYDPVLAVIVLLIFGAWRWVDHRIQKGKLEQRDRANEIKQQEMVTDLAKDLRGELEQCKKEAQVRVDKLRLEADKKHSANERLITNQQRQIDGLKAKITTLETTLSEREKQLSAKDKSLQQAQERAKVAEIAESYIKGRFDAQEKEIVRLHELLQGFQKPPTPPPNGDPKPPKIVPLTPPHEADSQKKAV